VLPPFIAARPRLFAGLLCGLIAWPLLPNGLAPMVRAVCAWDIGVLVYLLGTGVLFCSEHLDRMPADAERQQEGEWTIFAITVAVVVISLVAILGVFSGSKDLPPQARGLRIALVTLTLLASWLMAHATFCFRYAHEYYSRTPGREGFDGGLEFPGETRPDYLDFAYFSLVLGMTFQVSDVQITSRKLRRLAAVHGLLSFMFNTVILALTVNIAASFL